MDFEKICRLCCEEKSQMQSLFVQSDQHFWKDIFSKILQINIDKKDGLPQSICSNCMTVMENIQETIEQFRANDNMLREKLREAFVPAIKTEVVEIEDEPRTEIFQIEINTDDTDIKDEPYSSQDELNLVEKDEAIESLQESDSKLDDPNWSQSSEEKPVKKRRKRQPKDPNEVKPVGRRRRKKDPNLPHVNDHKCYICKSESLGSNEALYNHLYCHNDQLPYTCTICVKEVIVIDNVSTLNIHKRMHELPVKCDHCDRRYLTKYTYAQHVQRDHSGGNVPSNCELCGKVCPSKVSLQYHMLTHTKAVSCEYCGKMFSQKHKLELHIRRKHGESTMIECHICNKKLKSLDSLRCHIQIYHLNQEFKCSYCDKSYAAETSLRYHEKKHEQNPDYKSSKDWRQYYTFVEASSGLQSSGRLKKCNLCQEVVKSIGVHLKNMHFSDPFSCNLCGAAFKRRDFYDMHMLEHKHGKMYQCPICNKEFYMKRLLLAHLKTQKHRDHPLAKNLDWLLEKEMNVRELLIMETNSAAQAAETNSESVSKI
ncbi:zinc finger protein 37 homolog [Wyeomyia smithii]|uniref:zinc finger protein 37 homolog n=1 Tax=Wyeomyia smithii TaxID=174621 RepID=UPI002467C21D|nr:zinc finger protein 37 homolog [Wyeomyia smithii]